MNKNGFRNFYWGFLFIMIDFRIPGLDILPDTIGYILFAVGLNALASNSTYFRKAQSLNMPMVVLSIFSIYERPVQGWGVNFGLLGPFGVLIGIASIIMSLLIVYNLFMGIKEMAEQRERPDLFTEASERWTQYMYLQIAVIAAFVLIFIPPLAILSVIALLIAYIVLTIMIMGFMERCEESL